MSSHALASSSSKKARPKAARGQNKEAIKSLLPQAVKEHGNNVDAACRSMADRFCVDEVSVLKIWYDDLRLSESLHTQTTTTTAYLSHHAQPMSQVNLHGLSSQGGVQQGPPNYFPAMQPGANFPSATQNFQHFPSSFHPFSAPPGVQGVQGVQGAKPLMAPGGQGARDCSPLNFQSSFSGDVGDVSLGSLSGDFTNYHVWPSSIPSAPTIHEGQIDFGGIKQGAPFLDLVDSKPFWDLLGNYNQLHAKGGRKVGHIGGGHSELMLFSHPDALRKKYKRDGSSLSHIPVSLEEFAKHLKGKKKWTADQNTEFWIQFSEKWEEQHPGDEIVSLLLLCFDGKHDSGQDIHIDIGKGGGQFTLSVTKGKVLRTVAYPREQTCILKGGLYTCLNFLAEWNISQQCIDLIKEKVKTLFKSIENDSNLLRDGWNDPLYNSGCGSLLHDFKERNNNGVYETGQYLAMEGPIPHRAPTMMADDGQKRAIIFGVTRKKGSDYVYDFDDQTTAPLLIAMLLETLWPMLHPSSEPNVQATKSSLLFLFVSSLYRSNDLKTERNRFVNQADDNGYSFTVDIVKDLTASEGKMKKERKEAIAASNDHLLLELEQRLMEICDKSCSESPTAMLTDMSE